SIGPVADLTISNGAVSP
nr:laccase, phenoloxidase=lignin-degrading enzyme {N-terminal} {EC 1.10.3.2} [basidiomycete, PM1, CECT 2971, Peptide Partial, 17 aa] [basidiomycete PM1]